MKRGRVIHITFKYLNKNISVFLRLFNPYFLFFGRCLFDEKRRCLFDEKRWSLFDEKRWSLFDEKRCMNLLDDFSK